MFAADGPAIETDGVMPDFDRHSPRQTKGSTSAEYPQSRHRSVIVSG